VIFRSGVVKFHKLLYPYLYLYLYFSGRRGEEVENGRERRRGGKKGRGGEGDGTEWGKEGRTGERKKGEIHPLI